jgi:hypothetical protein
VRKLEEAAKTAEEHRGESPGPSIGGQTGANTGGRQTVGGGPGTTTGQTAGGPLARVAVASLSPARLLLELTVPGKVTVKIAHEVTRGHRRRWQTIKTITVQAAERTEVKLPRLPIGSYRVSVGLADANSVVKTLTVPRTRRTQR